jgi:hydrogenase-4 component B
MPWTATAFLVGAVAICGLPPLNGFVSELLVYLGLLQAMSRPGVAGSAIAMAAPVLAMIGALAVACFVKVFGAVFLGNPRSPAAMAGHESPVAMRVPMIVLAVACVLIGVLPVVVSPVLDRVVAAWLPAEPRGFELALLAPLSVVGTMAMSLLALTAALVGVLVKRWPQGRSVTWDCGYAQPTARMQYTASSFARSIVGLFQWVLRPDVHAPKVQGLFPAATTASTQVDDAMLDRVMLPAGRAVERWFGWCRRFQQGLTQQYVLYILIAVILMLGTLIPIDDLLARLLAR